MLGAKVREVIVALHVIDAEPGLPDGLLLARVQIDQVRLHHQALLNSSDAVLVPCVHETNILPRLWTPRMLGVLVSCHFFSKERVALLLLAPRRHLR